MLEIASYPANIGGHHLTAVKVQQVPEKSMALAQNQEIPFCETLDLDCILVTSFKQLLKMYNPPTSDLKCEEEKEEATVFAGGLQRYLIRQAEIEKNNFQIEQPRKGAGTSDSTTFHDLPDSLQLHIYSFLSATDLCRAARACRHWHMLSCDNLLWQDRLQQDMNSWSSTGHTSNPLTCQHQNPDWSSKEVYLQCSPEVQKSIRQQNNNFHQLSSLLRNFWPRKTPKVAMFGPGLESSTSSICRKILHDTTGLFKTTGMIPGVGGVGSGFTMKMSGNLAFHLSMLYTTTRKERARNLQGEARLQNNRMLAQQHKQEQEDEEQQQPLYELNQSIKELCKSIDAFVFVVDASQTAENIRCSFPELLAMLQEATEPSVPLVILSCVPTPDTSRRTCIEVVELLQLSTITRPWQIHDCVVDNMASVCPPLQWVVEQAARK